MLKQYGVLVVDDSALMRKIICAIVEESPQLYVIGRARNGEDAIEKVARLKPKIVTMDVEMPVLGGIDTLKILMEKMPIPVIMLSNDAKSALTSVEFGAVDFVIKEDLIRQNNAAQIEAFHKRLVVAAEAKVQKVIEVIPVVEVEEVQKAPAIYVHKKKDLLIIGSSTGGPRALQSILIRFKEPLNIPILIIQHMPPGFTKPLAERFDSICSFKVKEAEHNELLEEGTVYIAPAGIQTTLKKTDDGKYIVKQKLTADVQSLYKPSIDVALLSVAPLLKQNLLAVILTGMGDDGLRGCREVKAYGGTVITESEETCIVYGMPKVVFNAGLSDVQLPLPLIFDEIMKTI